MLNHLRKKCEVSADESSPVTKVHGDTIPSVTEIYEASMRRKSPMRRRKAPDDTSVGLADEEHERREDWLCLGEQMEEIRTSTVFEICWLNLL